jgi:alpha-glucosidase
MIKKFIFFPILFCLLLWAEHGISQVYSQGDSLTVFYPDNFDSSQTLPSLAIINEPAVTAGMPAGWTLIPEFYFDTASNASCSRIAIEKGTDLYGTGEVTGSLRRNNTEVYLWNLDNFTYQYVGGRELYQSHPWVLGVRSDGSAFGVIADNTWQMAINLSDTAINFYSAGPSFRIVIFEAESPQKVMQQLASLIGKMELPPLWALGYHQSYCSYTPDSYVRSIANTLRSRKLPSDVIWLDFLYQNNYKAFTFNPSSFSNPTALNDYLHSKNFKSVWIVDPGIAQQTGYAPYDQGTVGDYWVLKSNRSTYTGSSWPGTCVFPDFTMPAAQTWWSGLFPAFMANGIDGIWNDMNEPSIFGTDNATMPENNIHRGGGGLAEGPHLRYHNVYGMLEIKATREGVLLANPDKRPFVLTRSNFLGGQRYAATWTGDNGSTMDFLKMSIPMSLNLGLSGQPFSGPDVGGYSGGSTAGLVGHWMALGAFYPFYRNHHAGNPQEPWAFGSTIEQVSRIALSRRYRLMPYLYTLFYEASKTGIPVMRPVFFADPTDIDLRKEQEAFLFGDKLLIVPKWSLNPSLPKDVWRTISLVGEDSKLDPYQPDVRLRNGSIIPVGQLIQSTVDYSTDSLTLLVSIDDNHEAKGYLYEDAGNGYDYLTGGYLIRDFKSEKLGDDSIIITCSRREGNLPASGKKYNIGIVTNYNIFYTGWTDDSIIKIALPIEMNAKITSPEINSSFASGQDILLSAEASSDIGITKVGFFYDDSIPLGEALTAPYEIHSTNIVSGTHYIYAIAWASADLKMETYRVRVNISAATGINELAERQIIKIYPNPASEKVNVVSSEEPLKQNITLYDEIGRIELQTVSLPGNNTEIDISSLKNGIYFIEVKTTKTVYVQKLIIHK